MDDTLKDRLFAAATAFGFENDISIEMRGRNDGGTLWAVVRGRSTLNTEGYWEYEPMPSNRDDDYIARTRFTLEEAYARMKDALADPKVVD
jgi:hypothetical protein